MPWSSSRSLRWTRRSCQTQVSTYCCEHSLLGSKPPRCVRLAQGMPAGPPARFCRTRKCLCTAQPRSQPTCATPRPHSAAVFASIGRVVWRDVGPTAVCFRLLMKVRGGWAGCGVVVCFCKALGDSVQLMCSPSTGLAAKLDLLSRQSPATVNLVGMPPCRQPGSSVSDLPAPSA